tara:strand:- start:22758 stop:23243 length:486 start_codon:yes stop_codon:yes gene_type:complete
MLSPLQSLKLTLPDLLSSLSDLNLPFESSFDIEDFEVNLDIGLISFTGEKVLVNTSEFFKLQKEEQLSALAFISFCKENYSEFKEISNSTNIDHQVLNFASHFYAMKQLNDIGIVFEPSSINLINLKEDVTVSDSLTDTYNKFLGLGLDNVISKYELYTTD